MASKTFKTSKEPTRKIKGGLDAIMSGGIYAVPSPRKKETDSLINVNQRTGVQDTITHTNLNGSKGKMVCMVKQREKVSTRIGKGKNSIKVVIGDPTTYTFEMLIERYGSPRKFPTGLRAYDKEQAKMIDVCLLEKFASHIGKNRK